MRTPKKKKKKKKKEEEEEEKISHSYVKKFINSGIPYLLKNAGKNNGNYN